MNWMAQALLQLGQRILPGMALEAFLFSFVTSVFCVVYGRACGDTCDGLELLQRGNAERAASRAGSRGTWTYPRDWKTDRDLANVSGFQRIHWAPGPHKNVDVVLDFFSAVPVFGKGGNYIALLHNVNFELAAWLTYLNTGEESLFCSGPKGSHRTKVRGLGHEMATAHKEGLAKLIRASGHNRGYECGAVLGQVCIIEDYLQHIVIK